MSEEKKTNPNLTDIEKGLILRQNQRIKMLKSGTVTQTWIDGELKEVEIKATFKPENETRLKD